MDMGKIHALSRACYNEADEESKKTAAKLFNEMDKNGDGNVDLYEFLTHGCKLFGNAKYGVVIKIFRVLDVDKNGSLDFWEAVTFYYLMQSGWSWCDGCGTLLSDAHYFICATCFAEDNSYDLCVNCYSTKSSEHRNHPKCDGPANFVSTSHLLSVLEAQLDPQEFTTSRDVTKWDKYNRTAEKAKKIAEVVEVVGEIVQFTVDMGLCSIM